MSRIGEAGRHAERKQAKRIGGKQTPASGALVGAKGDVRVGSYLIEVKSTVLKSLRIDLGWLRKVSQEATEASCNPALSVLFTTEDGRPVAGGRWVLIREDDFREML